MNPRPPNGRAGPRIPWAIMQTRGGFYALITPLPKGPTGSRVMRGELEAMIELRDTLDTEIKRRQHNAANPPESTT